MTDVNPIPEGFHSITPYVVVDGANSAIAFYQRAFGAVEVSRIVAQDGRRLMHAEIRIGDSRLLLADAFPEWGVRSARDFGGSPVMLHHYCADADLVTARAVAAGAKLTKAPENAFWGDRYGQVEDPWGIRWSIATRREELSQGQIAKAARAAMAH